MNEFNQPRWKMRLASLQRAIKQLESGVLLAKSRHLSDLEQQGLIQSFEFCYELCWNLLRDYYRFQGVSDLALGGPRDTIKHAFKEGLISDGETWMEMIKSRNLSSHTYDEHIAHDIAQYVVDRYFAVMEQLKQSMELL